MKQKILFDNIIYSLQQNGGISSIWAILQNAILNNNDFECKFIEYNNAETNNIYRKKLNLPHQNIINPKSFFPIEIERYCKAKMPIDETFDIFHSSYYRIPSNHRGKTIVTVHDFIYEKHMPIISRSIHCKQKYSAIYNADLVVCVSQSTRNDLLHYLPNLDKNKITIIYNGISPDFHKKEDIEHSNRILFVGSRAKYKNFELLIETLTETSSNLDICGNPLSKKEQNYLNSKLGIERYKVYTNINNIILNDLYNSAYCLIYPSSYEGFGLPIIEAQQAGCPVIALNRSSVPEIIGETPLLMNEPTKQELLTSLKKLKSQSTYNEVIECGLVNSQRFTSKAMTDAYIDLYRHLI